MSWQPYIDDQLLGTGKVSKAAIISNENKEQAPWAISKEYDLPIEERAAIIGYFANAEAVQTSGIRLAGRKFLSLQADDRRVYGRKGADGCILIKTKLAILVAEYSAPIQAAEATPVVEKLADYLVNVGY